MAGRKVNRKWASGCYSGEVRSPIATDFEAEASRLGLTPDSYASSVQLRLWCEENRHRCYIPEWLLQKWKIPVDKITLG